MSEPGLFSQSEAMRKEGLWERAPAWRGLIMVASLLTIAALATPLLLPQPVETKFSPLPAPSHIAMAPVTVQPAKSRACANGLVGPSNCAPGIVSAGRPCRTTSDRAQFACWNDNRSVGRTHESQQACTRKSGSGVAGHDNGYLAACARQGHHSIRNRPKQNLQRHANWKWDRGLLPVCPRLCRHGYIHIQTNERGRDGSIEREYLDDDY